MILSKTEIDKLEDFIDGMPLIDYVVREIIDECSGTDDEPVIGLYVILKDDHKHPDSEKLIKKLLTTLSEKESLDEFISWYNTNKEKLQKNY